jgi:hypothetical protein
MFNHAIRTRYRFNVEPAKPKLLTVSKHVLTFDDDGSVTGSDVYELGGVA